MHASRKETCEYLHLTTEPRTLVVVPHKYQPLVHDRTWVQSYLRKRSNNDSYQLLYLHTRRRNKNSSPSTSL